MGSRPKATEEEEEEEEKFDSSSCDPRALCLYGDVLEAVASCVPTLDLVSASRVSREWRRAVRASLRRRPRRSPWLLLRLHRRPTSASASASLLAYDPHSRTWLPPLPHVRGPPPHLPLPLPRACPALHAASLSALAVARDPFGAAAWRAVEAPRVWRVDPVVAATAGGHVAVLGGACQLALGEGEDAGAVEVRGSDGCWEPCDPIPAAFDGSNSATWLSAATSDTRVYITDRARGWTSWFDPGTKKWGPTRQLRPDPAAASFAIGVLSSGYNSDDRHRHRLVLATAGRREGGGVEVRLWEADAETLDVVVELEGECAAEMPKEFAKRMFRESEEESDEDDRSWDSSSSTSLSVGLCSSGDGGYVYNASDPRKGMVRFYYDYDDDDAAASCKWEWIGVPMIMQKEKATDRVVVVGCTAVGLDDLALLFPYN